MSIKREEVQRLKEGRYIMVDGEPCVIKTLDDSQGGKHGAKVYKVICMGMFDMKIRKKLFKRGDKVEVPEVLRGTAQIIYIEEDSMNIMDHETYQQFDLEWPKTDAIESVIKKLQSNPSKLRDSHIKYIKLAGRIKIERIIME